MFPLPLSQPTRVDRETSSDWTSRQATSLGLCQPPGHPSDHVSCRKPTQSILTWQLAVLAHQHEFVPSCRIIQTSGPRGRWRSDPESIPQFWRQHGGTGPCRDRRGPGGGDCGSGWRKRTRSRTGASLSPERTRSSGQGAIGQRQPCPRHTTSHRHLIHHMTERGGGGGLLPVQCFRGLLSWQRVGTRLSVSW